MGVIKANSLNLTKVTFSDIRTDIHGRKMVYINYDSGKIMVQTPKMYAPNGVKRWRKADATNNKDDKFEMELSFYGENGTDKNAEEIREFHQKWKEFDEMLKNKIIEKSKEWLSMAKLDMNTLESVMYTPMVRVSKDKEGNELPYPSRIKAKIDREMDSNGNFSGRFISNKKFKTEVMIFDENKERIIVNEENAEDAIPKGCQVVSILELVYLTLSKTTISTKWKLVQAKVFRDKDSITGYALLDDDKPDDLDSIGEGLSTTKEVVEIESPVENANETAQSEEDDSDVEAEQEPEIDTEPEVKAPQPKPKGRAKRSVVA